MVRVDGRMVEATPAAEFDLRTVRDLIMPERGLSWLVGDGGLVRASLDEGRSWLVPGQNFSEGPGAQCDWHAAAVQGSHLWIVGSPGSVILHTADAGATWQLLPTGHAAPLYDAAFLDERRGFAVGALGAILATTDGGVSWRRVSREPHRASLWACFADAAALPAELLAHAAAEEGFRTAVTLLGRRDAEPGLDDAMPAVDRHLAAVSLLGAASAEQAWAFPLRQAALEPSPEAVMQAWGEGDAAAGVQFAQARLVRTLRMWRPDVVLTHAPSPRGHAPTTHFLHQLVLEAVDAAGDPTKFPEQIELLGLQPWQPRKVFGYDPDTKTGSVTVEREQILFCTAQSLDDFSEQFRSLVFNERRTAEKSTACRLVWNRTAAGSAPREFFAGIDVPIGGEARRPTPGDSGELRVRMRRTAERRNHMEAVVLQRSGIVGAGLVDRIRAVIAGQEPGPASDTVFHLAEAFRRRGRWEAARETYEFLAANFPQQATTEAALRRTIQYLASAEADHRLRRTIADLGQGQGRTTCRSCRRMSTRFHRGFRLRRPYPIRRAPYCRMSRCLPSKWAMLSRRQ
ncbi:MAG: YCF48-related protein [Pirellulales bacterium]